MCSDRWSDREKERWHRWQRNGFCPVCLRKWRVSSSDRANFQVQPSHVHWYGFSPIRSNISKISLNSIQFLSQSDERWMRENRESFLDYQICCTRMCPFVSFEMWALGVDFFAAIEIAFVHLESAQTVGEVAERSGCRRQNRRWWVAGRWAAVRTKAVVGWCAMRRTGRGRRKRSLTQSPASIR